MCQCGVEVSQVRQNGFQPFQLLVHNLKGSEVKRRVGKGRGRSCVINCSKEEGEKGEVYAVKGSDGRRREEKGEV